MDNGMIDRLNGFGGKIDGLIKLRIEGSPERLVSTQKPSNLRKKKIYSHREHYLRLE